MNTIKNTTIAATQKRRRPRRRLRLLIVGLASVAAFGAIDTVHNTSPAAADLCPTIVPGFGCDVVWDENTTAVSDTWRWLHDYLNGTGDLVEDSNEVISMTSRSDRWNPGCVRTFDVPSRHWMQVTDGAGNVYHLKKDSHNWTPTIKVWENGRDLGEYWAEGASFGDVHILFETRMELETWLGTVQYVTKPVMYVVACGGSVIY